MLYVGDGRVLCCAREDKCKQTSAHKLSIPRRDAELALHCEWFLVMCARIRDPFDNLEVVLEE